MGKKDEKRDKSTEVVAKLPKKKCCESKTRCNRCPLRMLKEGTLPSGYTVHRRKLVKIDDEHPGGAVEQKPGKGKKKTKAA